jgi:hypothetical protein
VSALAAERPYITLDMRDKPLEAGPKEKLNLSCVGGIGTDVRNHWPYVCRTKNLKHHTNCGSDIAFRF